MCTTIALVIITGLSCTELASNIGLLINKKLLVQKMPEPIKSHEWHGSTMLGSKCMLIGGHFSRTCETFDFSTQTWAKDSKLPKLLQQFAVANSHGKIFISGGFKTMSKVPTSAIYRHSHGEWDKLSTKLPLKLNQHLVASISASQFLIFGGESKHEYNTHTIVFDAEKETVQTEHPIELD